MQSTIRIVCAALIIQILCFNASFADQSCPPEGQNKESLLQLRQDGFSLDDDAQRNQLAISLTACLSDPDPAIRDGVVYEGLAHWMRAGQLSDPTLQSLLEISLEKLAGESDSGGFEKPFSVLVLSEVVRTDRLDPWMTVEQRSVVVAAAAEYLASITDYRGFSDDDGWRHGVAHASDLVLQLDLNEAIDDSALKVLMDAVAVQISPQVTHFYIYGEPGRLARSVFYAWRRGIVDEEFWNRWFEKLARPEPLEAWGESFSSQEGLAKRHNTLGFLLALHLNAVFAEDEVLADQVMETITAILGG